MYTGKKITILLISLLTTGSVCVAGSMYQEVDKSVQLRGEICEFEADNIYKMVTTNGEIVRVDLGKHSGRMLNRTPFDVTGTMIRDEKGLVLKMSNMNYKDPDPFAEYFADLEKIKKPQKGGLNLEQIRDSAFDHELPLSDNRIVYQNNVKKLTPQQLQNYTVLAVSQLKTKDKGAKVVFKGRAIQTVVDREVMEFWDAAGDSVDVVMNGAYCPLGQRCFIYGTLSESEKKIRIDLDYMESVDLPAEAYK
ncbi:MAG: hypothetical protein SPI71_01620 [Acidaminococcaceae bacterium]|nr:hypothetical protein [Acidaminococcaceae bacterium]